MIPKQIASQIAEVANDNIVSIVGDYVKLTRRGANFMGCCPFHNEKTPSFSVNAAKGFFHCFGCGKSGSAITFIMELERVTYPDALRMLGKRFGITVPEEQLSPEEDAEARKLEAQYALMEYAARIFEQNLTITDEGQALGMAYWRSRGFRDDIIAKFRLGYAINQGNALIARATADGYSLQQLADVGLVGKSEKATDYHDYFRGRVIFPIINTSGKVVGFGGRVLDAATKGVNTKYLNTPQTNLYNKSYNLYGIYQARSEISRRDKVFLVEGYTDVISMHQSGVANVVASCGTALTPEQVQILKRFTSNITILYDGDEAGVKASLKAIDMILHAGLNARLLLLPDNDDPDSFSRKHSADEFQDYVNSHEVDFLTYQRQALIDPAANDPIRKAHASKVIIASIAQIDDRLTREIYVKQCAKMLDISEQSVFEQLGKQLIDNATKQRDEDVRLQRQQAFAQQRAQQQSQQQPPAPPTPPISQPLPPDFPPDLSPSELAQMGYSMPTPQPTPAPQPIQQSPARPNDEVEMAEVMRFFVSYTQNKMLETDKQPTVAQYIIEALDADQIQSNNPTFNKILDEYRSAPDKSRIDDHHFMTMGDNDVASFVANAIGSRLPLSKIHSRYTVIKDESELLDSLVPRAVDELRMTLIKRMINDTMRQIQSASDDDILPLMEQLEKLNEIKRSFSVNRLGERAILQ